MASLIHTLKSRPLECPVVEAVSDGMPIMVSDTLQGPKCAACCAPDSTTRHSALCACHFIVHVPIVLHHVLRVHLFVDPNGEQEPDFVIDAPTAAADNTNGGDFFSCGGGGDHHHHAPSSAAAAAISAAVLPPHWHCVEDYSWLSQQCKPTWDPSDPERLVSFMTWIQKSYRTHQRNLFSSTIVALNERLQFEYASYLQGLDESKVEYFVQRCDPTTNTNTTANSVDDQSPLFVITVALSLYQSPELKRQWRQLLFRCITVMQFATPEERCELIDVLEDFEAVDPPIQAKYISILVISDSSPGSFRVTKEAVLTEINHTAVRTAVSQRLAATLVRLKESIDAIIPFGRCQAKLSQGPGSYIDVVPHIEDDVLGHWAAEQYVWLDTAQCLAELLGPPIIFESTFFGAGTQQQRFAVYLITDAATRLTLVVQVVFFSRRRVPLVTVSSAQYCLKTGSEAIRIQAPLDEKKIMKRASDMTPIIDCVAFADELDIYFQKLMPKLFRVCCQHAQPL